MLIPVSMTEIKVLLEEHRNYPQSVRSRLFVVFALRAFVGVTDGDCYRFLASQPQITEVNFWKPGGETGFQALQQGEPFIFKTHWHHNSLVGGGYFEGFVRLPVSTAWEFFGTGNGVESLITSRKYMWSRFNSLSLYPKVHHMSRSNLGREL